MWVEICLFDMEKNLESWRQWNYGKNKIKIYAIYEPWMFKIITQKKNSKTGILKKFIKNEFYNTFLLSKLEAICGSSEQEC